jgi:hypothetical protein
MSLGTGRAVLTISLTLALVGCSAGAGHTTDGATSDSDGAGVACPHPPDLTTAAPRCNSVVNAAQVLPFQARTGTPPAPAGGAIADGIYVSTGAEGWGAAFAYGRRITIVVLGGATQMLWNGEVLDPNGATVTLSFAVNARTVASDNQIQFTVDCSSASPSPVPPVLTYTAIGDQLALSLTTAGGTSVTTYTRTGCP